MATQTVQNQSIYFGGHDLTGRTNALALDYSADMQDASVLGVGTHIRLGGLKTVMAQAEGFIEIDASDTFLFDSVGVADIPLSFGASADSHGATAFTMKLTQGDLKVGAPVGDIYKYSAGGECSDRLIKGSILLNSKGTPLTSTGGGTALQLGAVSATKKIYAAMHVLGAGTGSVTCKLQSDATNAFSGAETDRHSFTAATAVSSQFASVSGAITDTWWRIHYTISGGAPSFKLVFVVGIL